MPYINYPSMYAMCKLLPKVLRFLNHEVNIELT